MVRRALISTGVLASLLISASVFSAPFRRGDANADGSVDVSDAVVVLSVLFLGETSPTGCLDALDANDDGSVDVSDAVTAFDYLFLAGAELSPPGPRDCGDDPTDDELACEEFRACGEPTSARVLSVTATGSPDRYTFSVTVESPDLGCEQFADWWEVITPEGSLVYRRVLLHSHVTEQPFRRSGGPVVIAADSEVIVRAHMNELGYSTQAMRGSPAGGFEEVALGEDFASELAEEHPLPTGCAF